MTNVPRLHLISNRNLCPIHRFPEVARAAAEGGVGAVHIRESDLPVDELEELVRSTQAALRGTSVHVLVNQRVDIVVLIGADGVHLPERDADPARVRELLVPGSLIGVSVHSVEKAARAAFDGADYVIAGHVFKTGSKPGEPGRGVEFIREITESIQIPVIAIGGIAPGNAPDVLGAGAHGIAVMSSILTADDPATEANEFVRAMDEVEVK